MKFGSGFDLSSTTYVVVALGPPMVVRHLVIFVLYSLLDLDKSFVVVAAASQSAGDSVSCLAHGYHLVNIGQGDSETTQKSACAADVALNKPTILSSHKIGQEGTTTSNYTTQANKLYLI